MNVLGVGMGGRDKKVFRNLSFPENAQEYSGILTVYVASYSMQQMKSLRVTV